MVEVEVELLERIEVLEELLEDAERYSAKMERQLTDCEAFLKEIGMDDWEFSVAEMMAIKAAVRVVLNG